MIVYRMFLGCVWICEVEYSKEAFSNTEAQLGSSGPAHCEPEMEKVGVNQNQALDLYCGLPFPLENGEKMFS